MATIKDVRLAHEELERFRRRHSVKNLAEDTATQLFRKISEHLKNPDSDVDTEIPPEAEKCLKTFLDFVSANGH